MDATIMTMIKNLKMPYIKLDSSYIAGTDLSLSAYSIIFQQSPENYIGTLQEFTGKPRPGWAVRNEMLSAAMTHKFCVCVDLLNKQPIYHEDNIREANSAYNDVIRMKKSDGARPVRLNDNYIAYLSSGLCSINASDSVAVDVYPYDNISFMVMYTVFKKDYKIHQFMRYRNLVMN